MKPLDLSSLSQSVKALSGPTMIKAAMRTFPGRVALVSSFGTESCVLLHLAAEIDASIPVIFLDTGKLFTATVEYKETLTAFLGLTNVQSVKPELTDLAAEDPSGALWLDNPDRCCEIRKIWPLARVLDGFDAWITGRKSFQTHDRHHADRVEIQEDRLVISPLLSWSNDDLRAYMQEHNLPRHPLERAGFPSVGCFTCTSPVHGQKDYRSGRWQGRTKAECGIHRSPAFGSA